MTNHEWLTTEDCSAMIAYVVSQYRIASSFRRPTLRTARRLRLLACAICRHHCSLIDDQRTRKVLEIAELFADDRTTEYERRSARDHARLAYFGHHQSLACFALEALSEFMPDITSSYSIGLMKEWVRADVIRDLFHFQDIPDWKPHENLLSRNFWIKEIQSIAKQAYEARCQDGQLDPLRLLILSDALEESGYPVEVACDCEHAEKGQPRLPGAQVQAYRCPECGNTQCKPSLLIQHLRSGKPHYRGCWAVDLILGNI